MLSIVNNQPEKTPRCTGHCCRSFSLPFNPGELQRLGKVQQAMNLLLEHPEIDRAFHKEKEPKDWVHFTAKSDEGRRLLEKIKKDLGPKPFHGHVQYMDIEKIADMTIYLGFMTEEGLKASEDPVANESYRTDLKHHYTCKHLLQNGDCGDYDHRPAMCSGYPYGEPCDQLGCTARGFT